MLFQPNFFRIARTSPPLCYLKLDNMYAQEGKNSGETNSCDYHPPTLVALLDDLRELKTRNELITL